MARKPRKGLTRREFLKVTAGSSAYLGAFAVGLTAFTKYGFSSGLRGIPASAVRDNDLFEYIVIGSGAGGGPVAANLAKAGYSVLLLEAGGKAPNRNIDIPAFHPRSTEDPTMSWEFFVKHYSDPARQAADSKHVPGKGIFYPRAATLGGCTAHNAMIALYPDNKDWNDIVELTGDPSWNARDMRSHFERMENASYAPFDPLNLSRHGRDGWLTVSQNEVTHLFEDEKLFYMACAAAQEAGILGQLFDLAIAQGLNWKLDPNDWKYVKGRSEGVYNIPIATLKGRRNGTRDLILSTLETHGDKLSLQTESLATQLIFDPRQPNLARGVEYLKGAHLYKADPMATNSAGVRQRAFATKEVILAGGAFNSPQLLMLSGIGDRAELEKNGISVRKHLPGVGKNLQDHHEIGVVAEMKENFKFLESCSFGAEDDACLADYEQGDEKSLYASNGVALSLIKKSGFSGKLRDMCIFGVPGKFRGYYPGWSKDAATKNIFSWTILRGFTENTAGTVSLRSNDPRETPEINFKLHDEGNDASGADVEAMLQGIKSARRMNGSLAVAGSISRELFPGPQAQSDDDIRKVILNETWGHHASCTNKIGVANDPMAVVDSKFKVHGLENVRIVDASVFPKIPGLFIMLPIYIMAEKASATILKDAGRSS